MQHDEIDMEPGATRVRPVLVKSASGRLTPAGIDRLRKLVDAGRPDREIARMFDITPHAVAYQRQKYNRSTRN